MSPFSGCHPSPATIHLQQQSISSNNPFPATIHLQQQSISSNNPSPAVVDVHQQKTFPSARSGSVRVDALRRSRRRHPGGRSLRAWPQYHASRCISPSDRCFSVSSRSVGVLFSTNTLALWPTVTIRGNGFIGYALASGLQCNG